MMCGLNQQLYQLKRTFLYFHFEAYNRYEPETSFSVGNQKKKDAAVLETLGACLGTGRRKLREWAMQ